LTEERGYFYNGSSSTRHDVTVVLKDDGGLQLSGAGIERSFARREIRLSPRLGAVRRSLYLPDGALCEIEDGPLTELLEKGAKRGLLSGLHRWENSLRRALIALLATVVVLWLFFQLGLPVLAEKVAAAIPPGTETRLGEESLLILDRMALSPSNLPEERRDELLVLFDRMAADLGAAHARRLEFRAAGSLGANAFALPSGIILLTDELVGLAENDEEIAAVLAHEIGHVRHRHIMRQMLQSSAAGLIIAALTGDIFSASSLAAAIPAMLLEAKYSRDMELEADQVALDWLRQREIPTRRFADMLLRLEMSRAKNDGLFGEGSSVADFISTHPATRERIEKFME
jgi:Zn-dependent protease with chaperone function